CVRAVSRMAWLCGHGVVARPLFSHVEMVRSATPSRAAKARTLRHMAVRSSLASWPVQHCGAVNVLLPYGAIQAGHTLESQQSRNAFAAVDHGQVPPHNTT